MMVRETGDLRQMRHAQNLVARSQRFETARHAFRGAAANPRVDLVEYERARRGTTLI